MKKGLTVYRFFDDHEEKHYILSSFDHQKLEELVELYKKEKQSVYASEFVKFLHEHDSEAEEVSVKDFYI